MRAGDALQVQCLAHGTPPLLYAWDKVNGSLSARVIHRAGLLRISPALPADAGTYRCLVTNRVGTAEAFAHVAVHGEPPPPPKGIRVRGMPALPGTIRALHHPQVMLVTVVTPAAVP